MENLQDENLQNLDGINKDEPVSFLFLEEKKYQQELENYKNELEKQLQAIENKYQKEFETLKDSQRRELKDIAQSCQDEILKIENNFKLKLEKEIEALRSQWLENKPQREQDFIKTILSEKFYD